MSQKSQRCVKHRPRVCRPGARDNNGRRKMPHKKLIKIDKWYKATKEPEKTSSEERARMMREFLAKGGSVQHIEPGVSTLKQQKQKRNTKPQ